MFFKSKKNEEEKSNLNSLFWKLPQLSQILVSEHGLVWPVEFWVFFGVTYLLFVSFYLIYNILIQFWFFDLGFSLLSFSFFISDGRPRSYCPPDWLAGKYHGCWHPGFCWSAAWSELFCMPIWLRFSIRPSKKWPMSPKRKLKQQSSICHSWKDKFGCKTGWKVLFWMEKGFLRLTKRRWYRGPDHQKYKNFSWRNFRQLRSLFRQRPSFCLTSSSRGRSNLAGIPDTLDLLANLQQLDSAPLK